MNFGLEHQLVHGIQRLVVALVRVLYRAGYPIISTELILLIVIVKRIWLMPSTAGLSMWESQSQQKSRSRIHVNSTSTAAHYHR